MERRNWLLSALDKVGESRDRWVEDQFSADHCNRTFTLLCVSGATLVVAGSKTGDVPLTLLGVNNLVFANSIGMEVQGRYYRYLKENR